MKKKFSYILTGSFLMLIVLGSTACKTKEKIVPPTVTAPVTSDVAIWLTNPATTIAFAKQSDILKFSTSVATGTTISVDPTTTYQTIDGFGYCLTGGSASVINAMGETQKDSLLTELFATDGKHIGVSYLRISIGSSDMSATDFTYDEVTPGATDPTLANFSIDQEKADLIPILKKILAINPGIKILGSPWTAPTWMKINTIDHGGFEGGKLNPVYYDVYASYLVKYIQAMKAEGITIDAITPQNEPLNDYNNPAMDVQATEEATFVKNSLGPQFKAAGLTTKIIVYDHNADRTDYPITIFNDASANPYVDGSAFHLYGGDISALEAVHDAFPAKNLYFTEQYTPSTGNLAGDLPWAIQNLIVGATRNWCKNVLEWNMATDPGYGPHTDGGCSTCRGAVTITGSTFTRNSSYYIIAHASKFVRPGAVRIASNNITSLQNVAFKNTDGSMVLVVLNNGATQQNFYISVNGKNIFTGLAAGAVATYVWNN